MSDLLTHIGRLEMVDVDLDKEPQCESRAHERVGPGTTVCTGPATHWVKSPCGHGGLRCTQRIVRYFDVQKVRCGVCDSLDDPRKYIIREL